MGLWMLLLLLLCLHLGNAPWTQGGGLETHKVSDECVLAVNSSCTVMSVSLPPPSDVSISSFNMEHTLSFQPGPQTPSDAHFAVQILRSRKSSWRSVVACSELTAGQTCNLTKAFKDPFDHYRARVQAFTPDRTSTWTESGRFQPLSDTVLGPPDVSVSGCGNCLILQLKAPTAQTLQTNLQLSDLYREFIFHVQRSRDGVQFSLRQSYQEEHVIRYLQPGVEYCVTVSVASLFNSNSVPSKPQCAFTSPPPPRTSLYLVYSLLGVFCLLALLLMGLVVYGSRLSFSCSSRAVGVCLTPQLTTQPPNNTTKPPPRDRAEDRGQTS